MTIGRSEVLDSAGVLSREVQKLVGITCPTLATPDPEHADS